MSDAMATYWTNFAKSGDPNGGGLPSWPEYREGKPQAMHFTVGVAKAGPVPDEDGLKGLDAYFAWRRSGGDGAGK